MIRFAKTQPNVAAPQAEPADTVHDIGGDRGGRAEEFGPATVPAAWPTGVSHLARAIDACQRCDSTAVCTDWLVRTPNPIILPPAFCPNPDAFKRVKLPKERG